jgi:predicted Fe-Mo cluster-binding NifX family protein
MKIAIESNDGITIKSPFLPTKGYVVYDVNESDIVSTEYRESISQREMAGKNKPVALKQNTVLNDCSAIITRGMDRSNVDIFKREGMDVFITFKTSTKDAVKIYMKELLVSHTLTH